MKLISGSIILLSLLSCLTFAQYPRDQDIAAAEYFIDTDPGPGNGVSIPVPPGQWEVDLQVDNLNVPVGSHIYVRAQSTNGTWSAPVGIEVRDYFVINGATLEYCEYYINTDPGLGNGTQVTLQSGQYPFAEIDNLNIRRGDKIFVRVKDSFNRWSSAKAVTFNFKNMHKAEYKIKLSSGGFTQPDTMTLSNVNDSSNIFIATKENIPWNPGDTVFVRFQTADRFYSSWTSDPQIIVKLLEDETEKLPKTYALYQNYPNPFNPMTHIRFSLPQPSRVKIELFNILGERVSTLLDNYRLAGYHLVDFNAGHLASGIYVYRIQARDFHDMKKMILMK